MARKRLQKSKTLPMKQKYHQNCAAVLEPNAQSCPLPIVFLRFLPAIARIPFGHKCNSQVFSLLSSHKSFLCCSCLSFSVYWGHPPIADMPLQCLLNP